MGMGFVEKPKRAAASSRRPFSGVLLESLIPLEKEKKIGVRGPDADRKSLITSFDNLHGYDISCGVDS